MSLPVRKSVKILLLNDKNELLLMCADDPETTTMDGKYHGRFWFTVGGRIEPNESIEEAAIREIHEETGLTEDEIEFGPVVWYGEFDLAFAGKPTRLNQTFIVAKTKQENVALTNLTKWEQSSVKKLAWFSLKQIINSEEVIYPVLLTKYLPDILSGNYPERPLEIDLAKQPSS